MSNNTVLVVEESDESRAAVEFLQKQGIRFSEVSSDQYKSPTLIDYGVVSEGLREIKHYVACHMG